MSQTTYRNRSKCAPSDKTTHNAESARLAAGPIAWVIARRLSKYGRTTAASYTLRADFLEGVGYWKLLPLFTDRLAHGTASSDAFSVVVLSLSGFVFLADGRADLALGRGAGLPASVGPDGGQ